MIRLSLEGFLQKGIAPPDTAAVRAELNTPDLGDLPLFKHGIANQAPGLKVKLKSILMRYSVHEFLWTTGTENEHDK